MSDFEKIVSSIADNVFLNDDKLIFFILIFCAISLMVSICSLLFRLLIGYVERILWPLKNHYLCEVNSYE